MGFKFVLDLARCFLQLYNVFGVTGSERLFHTLSRSGSGSFFSLVRLELKRYCEGVRHLKVYTDIFQTSPDCIMIPTDNQVVYFNSSVNETCREYTGVARYTFMDNLYPDFGIDYSTGVEATFASE